MCGPQKYGPHRVDSIFFTYSRTRRQNSCTPNWQYSTPRVYSAVAEIGNVARASRLAGLAVERESSFFLPLSFSLLSLVCYCHVTGERISVAGRVLLDGIPNCNDLSALPQILRRHLLLSLHLFSLASRPHDWYESGLRYAAASKKVRSHFYYHHYYRYRNAWPRRERERYRRKIRSISRNCESSRTARFACCFAKSRGEIVLMSDHRVFVIKHEYMTRVGVDY